MAQHTVLAGVTTAIMVVSFVLGILLALGHHLFYASLRDKPTTAVSLISGSYEGQQLYIAIGTAFAFLTKASFVLSVSTAYCQILWAYIRRDAKSNKPPTLGRLDVAHSGSNNIISLLTFPVWLHYPLLFSMALTVWLIPFASIVPPATLSVALRENITRTSMENPPQLDFVNWNFLANMPSTEIPSPKGDSDWFYYNGPSLPLSRTSHSVAFQKSILSIEPPFQKTNTTWAVNFNAPSLKCEATSPDRVLAVQKNIALFLKEDCKSPANFLAWFPYLTGNAKNPKSYLDPYYRYTSYNDLFFEADSIFKTDLDSTSSMKLSRKDRDAVFYISTMPGVTMFRLESGMDPCYLGYMQDNPTTAQRPLGKLAENSTLLVCTMHNSTYHARFDYTNNLQVITTEIEHGPVARIIPSVRGPAGIHQIAEGCATFNKNPSDKAGVCEYDPTLLPQIAYQSVLQAFTSLFTGNVTIPYNSVTITLGGSSNVRNTPLIETKKLTYLRNFDANLLSKQLEVITELGVDLQGMLSPNTTSSQKTTSDQLLGPTLEEMFHNFTISLLSSPLFIANTSSPTAPPKVQITHSTTEIIYVYRADRLWAAYGAAAFCTLISVIIGFLAIFISKASYSNSFSTILRFAAATKLSTEIVEEDLDGKCPLPKYLEEATVKYHPQNKSDVERTVAETKVDGLRTTLLESDSEDRGSEIEVVDDDRVDQIVRDRGSS